MTDTDEIIAGMAGRAAARRAAAIDPAAASARAERATSRLPRYMQRRTLAGGNVAYYWSVPTHSRPDIKVRSLALGNDFDAAVAVARRMIEQADAALGARKPSVETRTDLAKRFARLDALSRARALTPAESEQLESTMIALGMIAPDEAEERDDG